MSNDSYGFLGGGRVPAGKFTNPGDSVGGLITEEPRETQQTNIENGDLLFWSDGSKRMQLLVTVQTDQRDDSEDDDGRRRLFVRGQMRTAIQRAVNATDAKGLDVGGALVVTYTGDGEPKNGGYAPKLYKATYTPPDTTEEFIGTAALGEWDESEPIPF